MEQLKKSIEREEYLKALEIIRQYKEQCKNDLFGMSIIEEQYEIREKLLSEINMSIRLNNILRANSTSLGLGAFFGKTVSDLRNVSLNKLKKCRGFGQKSLDELLMLCKDANINIKP